MLESDTPAWGDGPIDGLPVQELTGNSLNSPMHGQAKTITLLWGDGLGLKLLIIFSHLVKLSDLQKNSVPFHSTH